MKACKGRAGSASHQDGLKFPLALLFKFCQELLQLGCTQPSESLCRPPSTPIAPLEAGKKSARARLGRQRRGCGESTQGSADGRARARHEGHTVHPSPAAIAARGLWARAQRRGRLRTEPRTGCPSRTGSAKPSVRRSQQAPVRHNRQVGRQTSTHLCPRRTPRHNFVCSPWLPCALHTSRRITPRPSSPPVARRGKADEPVSRGEPRGCGTHPRIRARPRADTPRGIVRSRRQQRNRRAGLGQGRRARAISALCIAQGAPSRREPANRRFPSRQHTGRAAHTHSLVSRARSPCPTSLSFFVFGIFYAKTGHFVQTVINTKKKVGIFVEIPTETGFFCEHTKKEAKKRS